MKFHIFYFKCFFCLLKQYYIYSLLYFDRSARVTLPGGFLSKHLWFACLTSLERSDTLKPVATVARIFLFFLLFVFTLLILICFSEGCFCRSQTVIVNHGLDRILYISFSEALHCRSLLSVIVLTAASDSPLISEVWCLCHRFFFFVHLQNGGALEDCAQAE